MPYIIKRNNSALTLVEMLIVVMILAVVSLAIYSVFSTGIKIWQHVNTSKINDDLNIFFDKLALELRGSFDYEGLEFLGRGDGLIFTTLVKSQRLGNKSVGRVGYHYNYMKESIERQQKDFSHIYQEDKGRSSKALEDVSSCRFSYYFFEEQTKEYIWLEEWQQKGLPLAVRLDIELENAKKTSRFTRTVTIPAGCQA